MLARNGSLAGAIVGLSFKVLFKHLAFVRVECDMLALPAGEPSMYHHVFAATGCGDLLHSAELSFTNEVCDHPRVAGFGAALPRW